MALKEEQRYRSWVEVDLDHFTQNWNEMKRLVGPAVRIMQVVKADAYGHGAMEIANVALKNGAACLGVANADEGVQLRVSDISAPIVILSPSPDYEIGQIIKYNLTPSVSDICFARELQRQFRKAGIKAPIHIEVDTGMGRGGTIHYEAFDMIREILAFPNVVVEGIFTHLAATSTTTGSGACSRICWTSWRPTGSGFPSGTCATAGASSITPGSTWTWSGRASCPTASTPRPTPQERRASPRS